MRVVLLDLTMSHYTIAVANALAGRVDLSFLEAEQLIKPWRSVIDPGINLIVRNRPRKNNPLSVIEFSEWIDIVNDLNPDVLHIQNTVNPWFDFLALKRKLPPTVVTVHDATRHAGHSLRDWLPGFLRGPVLRKSAAVIVHASSQRDLLCAKDSLPRDQVHIVQHPELGSIYRAVAASEPTAIQRDPDVALFFGGIHRYKGLTILVQAMEIVRKRNPRAKLVIAGKGDPISQYFPQGNVPKWVEALEKFIPEPEVSALFRRAAMVVLPYVEASQSGVACLAMGIGTPVVASAIGGLKELIRDGKDGVLVPPGDPIALAEAIGNLMADETRRSALAEGAVSRCQNDLSYGGVAEQTIKVYEQVLRKRVLVG